MYDLVLGFDSTWNKDRGNTKVCSVLRFCPIPSTAKKGDDLQHYDSPTTLLVIHYNDLNKMHSLHVLSLSGCVLRDPWDPQFPLVLQSLLSTYHVLNERCANRGETFQTEACVLHKKQFRSA